MRSLPLTFERCFITFSGGLINEQTEPSAASGYYSLALLECQSVKLTLRLLGIKRTTCGFMGSLILIATFNVFLNFQKMAKCELIFCGD